MSPLSVRVPSLSNPFSDDQFYNLCQANPDLSIERNANGELIFMPPTEGETGNRNAELVVDFGLWSRQTKLGKIFNSSTASNLLTERFVLLMWLGSSKSDGMRSLPN